MPCMAKKLFPIGRVQDGRRHHSPCSHCPFVGFSRPCLCSPGLSCVSPISPPSRPRLPTPRPSHPSALAPVPSPRGQSLIETHLVTQLEHAAVPWQVRACVLVTRRHDLKTCCIYRDAELVDFSASGPQTWFDGCDLPTRCPWSRRRPGPPIPILELMLDSQSQTAALFFRLCYDHDVPDMLEDELLFYLESHLPWEA